MADREGNRWDLARRQLVARWRVIVERIEAHDEAGVLELSTEMDEFCDEAETDRRGGAARVAAPGAAKPGLEAADGTSRGAKIPREAGLAGSRCLFCHGFFEIGGCLGLVGELNQAVLKGLWPEARRLAIGYLTRLESMDLS